MDIAKFIIRDPFDGSAENCVRADGTVYHRPAGTTAQQYMDEHPELKLRVVSEEEYHKLHEAFTVRSMIPITYEQWEEMLECLPPLKWHSIERTWDVFYCSEAMSGIYHGLYIREYKTNKCWSGIKSIFLSDREIIEIIQKEILDAQQNPTATSEVV